MSTIFRCLLIIVGLTFCADGIGMPRPTRPFDEFGDIKCEDEMARLDNFAVTLQNEPSAKGLIVIYGGRRFRGRLPKQGEAEPTTTVNDNQSFCGWFVLQ